MASRAANPGSKGGAPGVGADAADAGSTALRRAQASADRAGDKTEWVAPLPAPRDQIPDATQFRSTWLTASLATLRERGYGAAYEARLDPQHGAEILRAVPGVWLPMEVALAHYRAADAIGIPAEELVEIGAAATRRANATTFQFILRMAQGAGVTPWTLFGQTHRIWAATCNGGAMGVAKVGPKEARIEIVGFPLAALPYNRVTMRGILTGGIELFCKKAYVKELPELCDRRSIGLRASWV